MFICRRCRTAYDDYQGQCEKCGAWNVVVDAAEATDLAQPAENLLSEKTLLVQTPLLAVNRALGGIARGGIYLIGGEPGVGKSTLAVQMAGAFADALYITAEEPREAVASRARRVGLANVLILSETELVRACDAFSQAPFVVLDSLQALGVEGYARGSISAARVAIERVRKAAHDAQTTLLLISHVNKDDDFAGPRTVEHEVDATMMISAFAGARILRASKNRYAATGRSGWLRMTAEGFVDAEPSLILPPESLPGRILTIAPSGLPIEVQAARTTPSSGGLIVGLRDDRVRMAAALVGCKLGEYIVRADGDELEKDTGADLAIALALRSAERGQCLELRACAWGELTLDGRVLAPSSHEGRIESAQDLGLGPVLRPPSNLEDALSALGLDDEDRSEQVARAARSLRAQDRRVDSDA